MSQSAGSQTTSRVLTGRIVGNLDCESEFAREAALAEGTPLRQGPLSRRALATIAGAATLLRVFARPGDRLWLPAPVEAESMCPVDGLPRPELDSGSLCDLAPSQTVLAWGETRTIAAERARGQSSNDDDTATESLSELLWATPSTPTATASTINDRRFCQTLASTLGCRLPGARMVASRRALEAHLTTGGASASIDHSWVLKARFSAAGRWRAIQRPGSNLAPARIDRLFDRHGALLFEPWMERVDDIGYSALLTPQGLTRIGCHRLLVDSAGHFRGVELLVDADSQNFPWLDVAETAELERVLEGVSAALQREGHTGPFGIDAWRYRTRDGQILLQPLGEINGRMTFGLVARALVNRLRTRLEPRYREPGCRAQLRFGRQLPSEHAARPAPVKTVPLYRALHPTEQAIWLEFCPPRP